MPGYGEVAYGTEPYGTGVDSIVLEWGQPGKKFYEAGIDKVVLYPPTGPGVVWNGILSLDEAVFGGEPEALYYDGVKYLDVVASEDFQATLTAFTSPREFSPCDGRKALVPGLYATNQPRKSFGLAYRTLIGNDLKGIDYGYKQHIVYNCTATPSARSNTTIGRDISPNTKTWTINSVPPPSSAFKPTAHLVIDSREVNPYLLENLETILYGRDEDGDREAVLAAQPSLTQILNILANPITEPLGPTV